MRVVSRFLNTLVERYLPSAFMFALLLTLITVVLGMALGGQSPMDMAGHWYAGFWNFLEFSMQMVVVLVTGYALAKAPVVDRALVSLASRPRTQLGALITTMVIAAGLGFISWGLGFVGGTLIAIEIARQVRHADFRLLVAAAYTAVIATQPISLALTAPLLVNTPGHSLEEKIGLIPVEETLFSPTMIACAVLGFIGVLVAFILMAPKGADVVPYTGESEATHDPAPATERTPADRVNDSKIINGVIVVLGLAAMIGYFAAKGFNLELNVINFIFLITGMALHGGPEKYARCLTDGIPAASGIVLQFPFYAGIIGMMAGAGLIVTVGEWFASISSPGTFPLFTYVAAMLVNIFVPSAGGQWQVMGPVMIEASTALGVAPATVVNAVSVGDMTTNLLQPFFVLPALGLSRLGLKDIWGYCLTAMVVLIVICGGVFLLVPVLGW